MNIKKRLFKITIAAVLIYSFCLNIETAPLFAQELTRKQEILKTEKDLITAGMLYYRSKKYDAAIREWKEALTLNPENKKAMAYIKRAESRMAEENKKEEEKPAKKEHSWFKGWFKKETGLINVTAPPKEMIGVLKLDDCIKIAVKNSLPLQIAEKSMKLAEMRIFEARRNMMPSATIAFEETYGRVYGRRYYGRKQYVEGQQPVFHGGELYYTMKQSEVNLNVVRSDYFRIKNELVLQVKKAYYSFAKSKENLRMQTELSAEVEKMREMVDKGAEAGAISKLELLNVNSQHSQVMYQLASAEGDESVAELILKQAMNLETRERIEVEPLPEFKKIEIDYEKALMAAFMNRPEIKINSFMIDYYNYGKNIAKAKGWPKIDILGQWGLAKEEYVPEDAGPDVITGESDADRKLEQQWYAGIKASMPFWGSTGEYSWTKEQWVPVVSAFQGTSAATNSVKFKILDKLDYYSDNQLAEIDLDNARQQLIKIKQDVTLEVKESCFSYEKAIIQLKTASDKVKYQEKDLEFIKLRRGMDEVQDSNVIESMIKLAQEKFGYIQALSDCHVSLASVNKAIGIEDFFKNGEESTR